MFQSNGAGKKGDSGAYEPSGSERFANAALSLVLAQDFQAVLGLILLPLLKTVIWRIHQRAVLLCPA